MDTITMKDKEIIQKIKSHASKQGITHQQIADKMQIKEQSVQRMLSGKYSPCLKHVVGLAEAVGLEVNI